MDYLTKEEIVYINRRTVQAHGGNFVPPSNLLHEEALDYLTESVRATMFGEELYPTVADKAAVYMFNIVCNHVFQDGNKRTRLQAARTFVKLNGWEFVEPLVVVESDGINLPSKGHDSSSILLNFTLEMASADYSLDQVRLWFKENIYRN